MHVAALETGTTEGRGADGSRRRKRKHSRTAFFLVTFYIRNTEIGG